MNVEVSLCRKVSWLVGCEELVGFLQMTYSKRRTAYGIWKQWIASGFVKSGSGKKSLSVVVSYGRKMRSRALSRSPAGL